MNNSLTQLSIDKQFAQDILLGLSASPKYLSSKYFYNERGDELFQQIMDLEEYYLTRTEFSILEQYKARILELFSNNQEQAFQLLEFGAGDGLKTKILLEHFLNEEADFRYRPIDISGNVLEILENDCRQRFPDLKVEGIEDDYFKALEHLNESDATRKAVLFLGSNIGNFIGEEVRSFFQRLSNKLLPGDMVLIGVDLKKNPRKIVSAYDDAEKVTREFNLNLLTRINDELGGTFDRDAFEHYAMYDPTTGECKSYLLSAKEQEVYIEALDQRFQFGAWEPVYMELSRKYDLKELESLAESAGFVVKEHLMDENQWFVDTVWEKR